MPANSLAAVPAVLLLLLSQAQAADLMHSEDAWIMGSSPPALMDDSVVGDTYVKITAVTAAGAVHDYYIYPFFETRDSVPKAGARCTIRYTISPLRIRLGHFTDTVADRARHVASMDCGDAKKNASPDGARRHPE